MDEPTHIKVPHPEMTKLGKFSFATEVAFNALIAEAKKLDLISHSPDGLEYLDDRMIVILFKQCCNAIITDLA